MKNIILKSGNGKEKNNSRSEHIYIYIYIMSPNYSRNDSGIMSSLRNMIIKITFMD